MTSVFAIIRHTGSYSDYRAIAICYVSTEELAQEFCEKALTAGRAMSAKCQAIYNKMDRHLSLEKLAKLNKQLENLRSDVDIALHYTDANYELSYSYHELHKVGP